MKKLSITLALVLCLVLCVFAFASCGKKNGEEAGTTAAPTSAEPTSAHVHVRADEMTVDTPATCTAPGSKSYHCKYCGLIIEETVEEIPVLDHVSDGIYTVDAPATCSAVGIESEKCVNCGEIIDSTIREIPINPDAHDIAEWVEDEISLLNPSGKKTGYCSLCKQDIVKDIEYQPKVWNANDKDSGNKYDKRTYESIRGEKHFYPTDEDPLGNDLLIEFSMLYNETLATLAGSTFDITVGDGSDFVNIKLAADANARYGTVVGGFSARDRNDGKGAVLTVPTPAAIEANPAAKYPSIGEYGWHRISVRIHQEADIVEGAVVYTYAGEAYLDGNLILKFDLSKWAAGTPGALLFTATIEDGHLVYADNDAANSWGEIAIYDFYNGTDVYLAIADTYMTCGQEFVQQVEAVADPAPATFSPAEGVELSAGMYFRAKAN